MLNRRAITDYYRDRFLLWPILLFSLLAITNILAPKTPGDRLYGFKLAACALVAVLLANERLIVLSTGAGLAVVKLLFALAITRDWRAYGTGLLVSTGITVVLTLAIRRWKPRTEEPSKSNSKGVLFVVAGCVAAVAVVVLLKL